MKNSSSKAKPSASAPSKASGKPSGPKTSAKAPSFRLSKDKLVKIHDLMVKSRVLEERLIRMYKQSDGFFWIGAPGEEAFSIPLGMQVHKGEGKDFDYLHLHYRGSPLMIAMGEDPIGAMRQMKSVATDPYSGGRNFGNHYSKRAWNVVPVTSTIETQYQSAIGTGIAQKRHGGKGITIVTGGDAGTAEGDFASCLVWASRRGQELPILIIVANNKFGISTPYEGQHGETLISDRARAFNIKAKTINGNDVEESWYEIQAAMEYVRKERKPFMIEANVSRLYGHSSATGCNFVGNEEDCLVTFEKKLEAAGVLSRKQMDAVRADYTQSMLEMAQQVVKEPLPDASTIYDHTFKDQKGRYF